jgi:UDP-N-acetylglucosamine transferase subunit ALG13
VILVALGTHPQPMDRLVVALDQLIRDGMITEEVLIQSAVFGVRPQLGKSRAIMPFDELDAAIREASIVITHGGPGLIMAALAAGKRPLVVPRDPALHEHVDDHQMRFVRWLAQRRPIIPVWDVRDLGTLLAGAAVAPSESRSSADPAAVEHIRALLHD